MTVVMTYIYICIHVMNDECGSYDILLKRSRQIHVVSRGVTDGRVFCLKQWV